MGCRQKITPLGTATCQTRAKTKRDLLLSVPHIFNVRQKPDETEGEEMKSVDPICINNHKI